MGMVPGFYACKHVVLILTAQAHWRRNEAGDPPGSDVLSEGRARRRDPGPARSAIDSLER
jgi:hypothetical protein